MSAHRGPTGRLGSRSQLPASASRLASCSGRFAPPCDSTTPEPVVPTAYGGLERCWRRRRPGRSPTTARSRARRGTPEPLPSHQRQQHHGQRRDGRAERRKRLSRLGPPSQPASPRVLSGLLARTARTPRVVMHKSRIPEPRRPLKFRHAQRKERGWKRSLNCDRDPVSGILPQAGAPRLAGEEVVDQRCEGRRVVFLDQVPGPGDPVQVGMRDPLCQVLRAVRR
ncbi:hypothetical protein A8926_3515 [Saccharopolyspora spinosa]|uniref:Uncharacterized protein n=1 Tax=Saccharopolyspora spinosa TaxID=60894 RepID=A0A2N3XYR8_SACSN|nr:hypothetical protein A8926_3515 [Saccharopolyspora spinosa]